MTPESAAAQGGAPEPAQSPSASAPGGSEDEETTVVPPEWIARQGPVVLDTSFVLALVDAHPRVTHHRVCLPGSILTSVALAEVFAKVHLRTQLVPRAGFSVATQLERWLIGEGVRVVDLPAAAMHHIPELVSMDEHVKAADAAAGRRRTNLSLADKTILATAVHAQTPVLTGDRHWSRLRAHGLPIEVFLY